MIAARRGTRAGLHQVGALLNQRVSVLVCVGVCVGVRVGTGGVCGAVELAGVCVCVCRVCVCVCAAVQGRARVSRVKSTERERPGETGRTGDERVSKTAIRTGFL